jgi:hypothetical protein
MAPGSEVDVIEDDSAVVGYAGIGAAVVVGGSVTFSGSGVDFTGAAPDDPKLLDAVMEVPLLIPTLFMMTTSPSTLVILTSTVVVPKPIEFSKKL